MTTMELDLKLRLDTALLIGSHFTRGKVQKLMVRNHDNRPYIPATTLKGRLRYYLERFATQLRSLDPRLPEHPVETLLGKENQPGLLYFDNAVLPVRQLERRSGIMVNRMLGSVEGQFLRSFETCVAGQVLTTTIEGAFPANAPIDDLLCLLLGALRLFDKLGSSKSAGLGSVRVEVVSLKLGGKQVNPRDKLAHHLNRRLVEVQP